MERRFTSPAIAPLEARTDGDKKRVGGYAAVFFTGDPSTEYELWDTQFERAVERINPGAFTKALARPDDCRCLKNHDANLLLGRTTSGTLRLSVDGRGLLYECDLPDTTYASDLHISVARKDCTGSSFAFVPDEEKWTETKDATGKWQSIREILSLTLFDASPVTFNAYGAANVGLRSISTTDEARAALDKHRNSAALAAKIAAYRERAKLVG